MNSRKIIIPAVAVLLAAVSLLHTQRPTFPVNKRAEFTALTPFIAHAGGQIDSHVYTNSRQALMLSYQNGFRLIELDFGWTADKELVLIHDWEKSLREYFKRKPGVYTLEEFRGFKMEYGLTQLTLDGLAQWMRDFPGAYIVTDVKDDNIFALEKIRTSYPDLAARFIPQIYSFDEYQPVRNMGYERIILTLYRSNYSDAEIIEFARNHDLLAVTMPVVCVSGGLPVRLGKAGVPVFVHTINDPRLYTALTENGVYGVYTDFLLPEKDNNK